MAFPGDSATQFEVSVLRRTRTSPTVRRQSSHRGAAIQRDIPGDQMDCVPSPICNMAFNRFGRYSPALPWTGRTVPLREFNERRPRSGGHPGHDVSLPVTHDVSSLRRFRPLPEITSMSPRLPGIFHRRLSRRFKVQRLEHKLR